MMVAGEDDFNLTRLFEHLSQLRRVFDSHPFVARRIEELMREYDNGTGSRIENALKPLHFMRRNIRVAKIEIAGAVIFHL